MDFAGFPVGSIENGYLRIEYLKKGALRLVRFMTEGSNDNLFVELPDAGWETPNGYFRLFGGHRLWIAPEKVEITYLPEPEEIIEEKIPGGVRLAQVVDLRSGLQKTMEITMDDGKASFSIKHILANRGEGEIDGAAWAITQFRLGGIAAIPQPDNKTDAAGLLPNRNMVFWPYSRLNDPRLARTEFHLMIRTLPVARPCKVGYFGAEGWLAYLLDGLLIRKSVDIQPSVIYPDMNSALEIYVNDKFIELESLSPLVKLRPSEQISHEEHWTVEKTSRLDNEEALEDYLSG